MGSIVLLIWTFITVVCPTFSYARPQDYLETLTSPELPKPIIRSLNIHSNIKYTYATTLVSSRILNPANKSQEVNFRVVLPEEAFITGLKLTIKDKSYDAYVKGKEEAKKEYDAAVSSGQSAAHVYQENSRDSKDFTIAVNVEPQEKVKFDLTYDELLIRKNKTYKHEININPHQIVPELSIIVDIEDILNIRTVQVPKFITKNEIFFNDEEDDYAKKTFLAPNKVRVEWAPSTDIQTQLNTDGLNGQMIVKYDVDTSQNQQQLIVDSDGYFVHILRNDDLPVLNKHAIFVLDVSGSMSGSKLQQLKDAMDKILQDLSDSDRFSIVLFSESVMAWGPNESYQEVLDLGGRERVNVIPNEDYIVPATKENVKKALTFINSLSSYGGTNILGGLRNGLDLAKLGQKLRSDSSTPEEVMVIFLTDGQPNVEESDPQEIIKYIRQKNTGVTIFSLGFGFDLDMKFLRKLSLANGGFARRIYEGSDASLQLHDFYKGVSSPVLSNISFEYLPDQVEKTTSNNFKNLFSGSEVLVLGRVKPEGKLSGALIADTPSGRTRFEIPFDRITILPPIESTNKTLGHLEKMWAYKTIKTLLDKNTVLNNDTMKEEAKKLALKYSFVTPLTSLVVVKPNSSSLLEDEAAARHRGFVSFAQPSFFAHMSMQKTHSSSASYNARIVPGPPLTPSLDMALFTTPRIEHERTHYSNITWLKTESADQSYLSPPSIVSTTDVIALNETDTISGICSNGDNCRHFIHCVLTIFIDDVSKYIPYQCHISPRFLGVCCPF